MKVKLLSPGMKDCHNPGGSAHVFSVTAKGDESVRGGRKKKLVQGFRIIKDQRIQLVWKGEDHMIVGDPGDQFSVSLHHPLML